MSDDLDMSSEFDVLAHKNAGRSEENNEAESGAQSSDSDKSYGDEYYLKEEDEEEVEEEEDETSSPKRLQLQVSKVPCQMVIDALIDVAKASKKKKASSYFVCQGIISPDLANLANHGLKVGNRLLGLPLDESILDLLTKRGLCVQAPFGRGEETLTDLSVRKTYQVEAAQVTFENPRFMDDVQVLAKRCVNLLGIAEEDNVVARFHKLLVYGPGDFFKPHRDSVHSEHQFGTMVLQLPSEYTGGALVVRKGGTTQKVDQSGPESHYSVMYTAFFADCLHEVLPIESGVRTCITFDLCYQSMTPQTTLISSAKRSTTIAFSADQHHVDKIESALLAWHNHICEPEVETESFDTVCKCGQKIVKPTKFRKWEYMDHPDPWFEVSGDKFIRQEIKWFPQTDSAMMVLVLDHLLPRNLIGMIATSDDLSKWLWAFRGRDRVRLATLLDGLRLLEKNHGKQFDVHLAICTYGGSSDPLDAQVQMNCALTDHTPVPICSCMARCFSKMTGEEILHETAETGNEASNTYFKYEFCGLLIYPRPHLIQTMGTLIGMANTSRPYARAPNIKAYARFVEKLSTVEEINRLIWGATRNRTSKIHEFTELFSYLRPLLPPRVLLSNEFLGGDSKATRNKLKVAIAGEIILFDMAQKNGDVEKRDWFAYANHDGVKVIGENDVLVHIVHDLFQKRNRYCVFIQDLALQMLLTGQWIEPFKQLVELYPGDLMKKLFNDATINRLQTTLLVNRECETLDLFRFAEQTVINLLKSNPKSDLGVAEIIEKRSRDTDPRTFGVAQDLAEYLISEADSAIVIGVIRSWFYYIVNENDLVDRKANVLRGSGRGWSVKSADPPTPVGEMGYSGTPLMRSVLKGFMGRKLKALEEAFGNASRKFAEKTSGFPKSVRDYVLAKYQREETLSISTSEMAQTGPQLEQSLSLFGIQYIVKDDRMVFTRVRKNEYQDALQAKKSMEQVYEAILKGIKWSDERNA